MPEERIFTIPLRCPESGRKKRAPRAVRRVREFLQKHMKTKEVLITQELNHLLWSRGREKPPPRVRVRAVKRDDGVVEAYPVE
ncbi:MAG: 50S ribosomal protein L31e [Candidatus Hadarchaeales archaeon]